MKLDYGIIATLKLRYRKHNLVLVIYFLCPIKIIRILI